MSTYISDTDAVLRHLNPTGKAVLDIGSGAGANVRWFAEQGATVTGVECGPVQLQRSQDADPNNVNRYVDAPGQDLPFDDNSFDLVTFFHSLHHVPQPVMGAALAEAARVVRPDGVVYVSEPVPIGPGHEMFLPIDDETAVRGYAQDALDVASTSGLVVVSTDEYTSAWEYANYDECVEDVIGVDPERQALLAAASEALEANFYAYAERTSTDGYAFPQLCKVTLLRKA